MKNPLLHFVEIIDKAFIKSTEGIWRHIVDSVLGVSEITISGLHLKKADAFYSVVSDPEFGLTTTKLYLHLDVSSKTDQLTLQLDNWYSNYPDETRIPVSVHENWMTFTRTGSFFWDPEKLQTILTIQGPFHSGKSVVLIEIVTPTVDYQNPIRYPVQPIPKDHSQPGAPCRD